MTAPLEYSNIRRYFYIGSITAIFLLTSFLSYAFISRLDKESEINIEELSSSLIKEKKQFLKNTIEQVVLYINVERDRIKNHYAVENLTSSEIDSLTALSLKKYIHAHGIKENNYIWVNQIINYDGGDGYAIRLIHPNKPGTEGMKLSTNMKDKMGTRPYAIELEGMNENGELFFEYYFKKPGSDFDSRKMSYAKLYKPMNLVVATGVYLDDVDALIRANTVKSQEMIDSQIYYSAIVILLSISIAIIVLRIFEAQIRKLVSGYKQEINDYTELLINERDKAQKALAKVKQLSGLLPICAYCKNIRNDEGYYEQIETYIHSHSEVDFSHTICPDCATEHYPNYIKKNG